WVQALSLRVFGFHIWALVLPQVVEGVLTILVLYRAVRRLAGPAAGLIAAAMLAVTPITVLLSRGNVSDSLLILLRLGVHAGLRLQRPGPAHRELGEGRRAAFTARGRGQRKRAIAERRDHRHQDELAPAAGRPVRGRRRLPRQRARPDAGHAAGRHQPRLCAGIRAAGVTAGPGPTGAVDRVALHQAAPAPAPPSSPVRELLLRTRSGQPAG